MYTVYKVPLTKNFPRAPLVAYNYRQKGGSCCGQLSLQRTVRTRFRVRISGSLCQSNICNFFLHWDLAVVRIIGVSVLAVCPIIGAHEWIRDIYLSSGVQDV